jgi:hypothetical protein
MITWITMGAGHPPSVAAGRRWLDRRCRTLMVGGDTLDHGADRCDGALGYGAAQLGLPYPSSTP